MGNVVSWSTHDVANAVADLGPAYAVYRDRIESDSVDGRMIESLTESDVGEIFKELGITSIIHQKKIRLLFADAPVQYINPNIVPSAPSVTLMASHDIKMSSISIGSAPSVVETTDVFITHCWGLDSMNRDNHERVGRVLTWLQANGISCWFDSERMVGSIRQQMTRGIDNARCVVVFITSNYRDKVNQHDDRDNCRYEFTYSVEQKGPHFMIPVVMEPDMTNPRDWRGELGAACGTKLYINMTSDAASVFYEACERLKMTIQRTIHSSSSIATATGGGAAPALP